MHLFDVPALTARAGYGESAGQQRGER
jgi:hypothetical protein